MSQPPLSRQIRHLEEELGVKLLHRTKREVRLTEAGARIVNEAHRVLGDVDHLTRVAARTSGGDIGHLSIGVPGGLNEIPIRALKVFAKECRKFASNSTYEYGCSGRKCSPRLTSNRFLEPAVRETGLTVETLKNGPLWIALPKGHPAARYERVPPKALEDDSFVMFARPVNPGLYDVMTGACRKAGFSPNVVHEVE